MASFAYVIDNKALIANLAHCTVEQLEQDKLYLKLSDVGTSSPPNIGVGLRWPATYVNPGVPPTSAI